MKLGCETPFFIWFTGRTGSTFLCDLLNSHPDVHCRMEDFTEVALNDEDHPESERIFQFNDIRYVRKIFSPVGIVDDPDQQQVLDYLAQIYAVEQSACGFKFKFPSQAGVFPEVLPALRQIENLKVVSLIRDNALKQAISLSNVQRIRQLDSKVACNVTEEVSLAPLHVDVKQLVSYARYFLNSRKEFDAVANQFQNVLQVTYEQLNSDTVLTARGILEFLNVDPNIDLKSRFFKATPDRLADAIANYDDVVQSVAGTDLEAFLD